MTKPTSSAFFSYSRVDAEFVIKLARDLRTAGSPVWLDQLDIKPGEHWDNAIEDALERAPIMLVVLSPTSVESTNVMDEVSFALDEKKPMIPVLYRDCKIPFRLRRMQYIDFRTDYQHGLATLVGTLNEAMAHPDSYKTVSGDPEPNAEPATPKAVPTPPPRVYPQPASPANTYQPPAYTPSPLPTGSTGSGTSSRKYLIGGIVLAVLLLIIIIRVATSSNSSSSPSGNMGAGSPSTTTQPATTGPVTTEPSTSQPATRYTPPAQEKPHQPDTAEWLRGFIAAGEGPSVSAIRPYFDDTVSPYYSMRTATWEDIARDKQAYFTRFPTIHYALAGDPAYTSQGDGQGMLAFDLQYSAVRFDGHTTSGTTHVTLSMRSVDGQWKVTGISAQNVR